MTNSLEESTALQLKFDEQGLICCVTVCADTNNVLMVAYMNQDALQRTQSAGEMYYWSRSRGALWHKGATSGEIQELVDLFVDCDQDCLLARVKLRKGPQSGACHTGRPSCFYRRIEKDGTLEVIDCGY